MKLDSKHRAERRGPAGEAPEPRPVLTGRVKWFDAEKGYGFVVPDDGGADIMIHATCLREAGCAVLPQGTTVTLLCRTGERGLQAEAILDVTVPAAPAAPVERDASRPTDVLGSERATGPLQPARVKWFDPERGFGFVNVFGSPEDVFVHMETVRRFGFQSLASGECLAVRTVRGPRGLMVAELRPWEASHLAGDRL